jgi:integrase
VLALPRIGTEKKLPVVLRRAEVWCRLDQVRQPPARLSLRLRDTCGLRVSEAVPLRVQDIDSQRRVVWVRHGKGAKDRSVPLPQQTWAERRAYGRQDRPATWRFPANRGTPRRPDHAVRGCRHAALRETPIRKKVSCHTLRHS